MRLSLIRTDRSEFMKRDANSFHDLYTVASRYDQFTRICAFNIIWAFVRFFRYLQLYRRFLLLWDVLEHAMHFILPFMMVILLIFLAFSFSGYWLFGQRVSDFHTMGRTLTNMMIFLTDGYDYQKMKDASPIAAPIWCISWTLMAWMVMLNMFIAILSDSFTFVQCRTEKIDQVEDVYQHLMPSWTLFLRSKVFPIYKPRDEDLAEQIAELIKSTKALRSLFGEVNEAAFWAIVQRNVTEGDYTMESRDVAPLFHAEDDPETAGREWLIRLAMHGRIPHARVEDESTPVQEMNKLTLQVNTLEKEMLALCSVLGVTTQDHEVTH